MAPSRLPYRKGWRHGPKGKPDSEWWRHALRHATTIGERWLNKLKLACRTLKTPGKPFRKEHGRPRRAARPRPPAYPICHVSPAGHASLPNTNGGRRPAARTESGRQSIDRNGNSTAWRSDDPSRYRPACPLGAPPLGFILPRIPGAGDGAIPPNAPGRGTPSRNQTTSAAPPGPRRGLPFRQRSRGPPSALAGSGTSRQACR